MTGFFHFRFFLFFVFPFFLFFLSVFLVFGYWAGSFLIFSYFLFPLFTHCIVSFFLSLPFYQTAIFLLSPFARSPFSAFILCLVLSFAKLPFYAFIYSRLPFFRLFPLLGFIFCFPIDSVSSFCFLSYLLPFSFFILYQSSLFFCTPFCPFPAFSFGFISCQTAFCIFYSAIFHSAILPVKAYAVYAPTY